MSRRAARFFLAEAGLSDIREIVPQPNVWPWVTAAILLLLLVGFFVWLRRRKRAAEAGPEAAEAPDLKALRLLDQLRERGEAMEAEAFTVEVSSILRHYLEEALQVPAPEQTSEEFLQELRGRAWLTPDLQQNLEGFMRMADLVKFARQPLDGDQRRRLLESARQVIDATRPQPGAAAT